MPLMTVHRRDTPGADAGSRTREDYTRQVRIACDDLHDDPYEPAARAAMFELFKRDIPSGPILQPCRR
jgi:hypothetical protein